MTEYGLDNVSVEEGGETALAEVDLEVAPGSITVLIGADGAGKSTAARVMVGLRRPRLGRARRPADRRRIGYQPESAGTWAELTVAENLAFVAAVHRLGSSATGRVDALLEVTGLTGATTRLAGRLSGGMRQKLAVAMAMLPEPELAVLDEATTGLDPVSRSELWRLLARSAGEGTAILATTSYLDEADRADRVVVLDDGRVLAAGTADQIRAGFEGTMAVSDVAVDTDRAWRRGREWRVWSPGGESPSGTVPVAPDLEDVVTAAALRRRDTA